MNSTKKNIQKTSGTHKAYKPGQLITIDNCVFRIVENRGSFPDCYMCNLDLYQQRKYCIRCFLSNLPGYYFKIVKYDTNRFSYS